MLFILLIVLLLWLLCGITGYFIMYNGALKIDHSRAWGTGWEHLHAKDVNLMAGLIMGPVAIASAWLLRRDIIRKFKRL